MSMLLQDLASKRPPIVSLLIILLTLCIGLLVGSYIGLELSSLFYEGDFLTDFQNPDQHKTIVGPMLLMQGVASLVGFIIFPSLLLLTIDHKPISVFFPSQPKTLLILFLVALLCLTYMISISPLVEWNVNWKFPEGMKEFEIWARQKEDRATKLTHDITNFQSVGDLLIGLVVIALLPAIGEELVFRGMIQNEFWRSTQNIHISIWISAIIFSAIHLQFFGFIPRVLLGALFGYLYYWSGNLLIPMFAHFFNNAFQVVIIYLNHQKITDINVEDNTSASAPYVILNLILTVGLLYYIWRHYNEPSAQPADPPRL